MIHHGLNTNTYIGKETLFQGLGRLSLINITHCKHTKRVLYMYACNNNWILSQRAAWKWQRIVRYWVNWMEEPFSASWPSCTTANGQHLWKVCSWHDKSDNLCAHWCFDRFFFCYRVTAIDSAKLWIIDRLVFQTIMMRTGMMRQAEHIAFLKRYAPNPIASSPRYTQCCYMYSN